MSNEQNNHMSQEECQSVADALLVVLINEKTEELEKASQNLNGVGEDLARIKQELAALRKIADEAHAGNFATTENEEETMSNQDKAKTNETPNNDAAQKEDTKKSRFSMSWKLAGGIVAATAAAAGVAYVAFNHFSNGGSGTETIE